MLLPHRNLTNNHLPPPLSAPSRPPLGPGLPKVLSCSRTRIDPRLATQPIRKPTIRPAHRDIQNQIKVLVERRARPAGPTPRIDDRRPVRVARREAAPAPEGRRERRVQHLQQARVDVGEKILLAPLQAEGVEGACVRRVQRLPLDVGAPPRVHGRRGAPVQRAADDVVAALGVGPVVAARLRHVDLAGRGPGPVGGVHGEQPDRGPEPVALGELGGDFDAAEFDGGAAAGVDAAGLDRVDDSAVCGVG